MIFIVKVAVGRREVLSVFGSDFDTLDGTGTNDIYKGFKENW